MSASRKGSVATWRYVNWVHRGERPSDKGWIESRTLELHPRNEVKRAAPQSRPSTSLRTPRDLANHGGQRPRKPAEPICAAAGAQIKHHAMGARVERTRTDDSRERSRQVHEE